MMLISYPIKEVRWQIHDCPITSHLGDEEVVSWSARQAVSYIPNAMQTAPDILSKVPALMVTGGVNISRGQTG